MCTSPPAAQEERHLRVAFDLWLLTARGGASAPPANLADVSLCTDEECLMRKGWDPDKLAKGGRGRKNKELLLAHYLGRYLLPFESLRDCAVTVRRLEEEYCQR